MTRHPREEKTMIPAAPASQPSKAWKSACLIGLLAVVVCAPALPSEGAAPDVSANYSWQPIRIGAGGWACGIIVHPMDAKVRYLNDDTGQTYRWDNGKSEWMPMIVRHTDGSGFPTTVTGAARGALTLGMALDPSELKTVYLYTNFDGIGCNVYKSVDGGVNFTATNMSTAAGISEKKNDEFKHNMRSTTERIRVDPNNSKVLYLGTGKFGLFRSVNGGLDWSAVTDGNAPSGAVDLINVHICKGGGTTTAFGQTVSKVICVLGSKGGGVYLSSDGGQTWKDIASGMSLAGKEKGSSDMDQSNGALYVCGPDEKDANKGAVWRYADGAWSCSGPCGGVGAAISVDPKNPNRLFRAEGFAFVSRSLDAGHTWQQLKWTKVNKVGFAGIRPNGGCVSAIKIDQDGCLWMPEGNDGLFRYQTRADNSETETALTIDCKGIENLVPMDITFPQNGAGRIAVAVQDETGMIIRNPDTLDVCWAATKQVACSCGHSVNYCPNDPETVAISSVDLWNTGTWKSKDQRHSAITTDNGATWTEFLDLGKLPPDLKWGRIAISRRGDWKKGGDHMVWWCGTTAPYWSKDGGKTWTITTAFDASGKMKPWKEGQDMGFATHHPIYWITDRALVADPFTPDKYFLRANALGCFVSTDGGVNWEKVSADPAVVWQPITNIEANHVVKDDLWMHVYTALPKGVLFHSIDGGKTWTKAGGAAECNKGGESQYTIFPIINSFALGAGSGKPGDAPYTVYVSGTYDKDPQWGVFRSVDAGKSWQRIAYYPYGLLNATGMMAASWDEFGTVGIAAGGQGYVYGKLKAAGNGAAQK
jgi:hypothetical protein